MPNITLGTFNIGKGATKFQPSGYSKQDVENTLKLIAGLIDTHDIDVTGLQEVDVNSDRNKNVDEPSFLRDTLKWPTRSSRFQSAREIKGGFFGSTNTG